LEVKSDPQDDARQLGEQLDLFQHGKVVCGAWARFSAQQVFSGYIAGTVSKGTLVAYRCNDDGQPSAHMCPAFEPESHAFTMMGPKLFDERSGIAFTFEGAPKRLGGDDVTEKYMTACEKGTGILLHTNPASRP